MNRAVELIERLATALEVVGARIEPRTSPEFRIEDHSA